MGILIDPKDRVRLSYHRLESGTVFISVEKTSVVDPCVDGLLGRIPV